jgi:hypothetical protein
LLRDPSPFACEGKARTRRGGGNIGGSETIVVSALFLIIMVMNVDLLNRINPYCSRISLLQNNSYIQKLKMDDESG